MNIKSLLFASFCFLPATYSVAQTNGVINNANSPGVKLKSINITDCQWTSGFWADKFKVCEETMMPNMGELLTGDVGHALNNFKIAAGLKQGKHEGPNWHDGDFYKWMESAAYVYARNKDPKILKQLDDYIEIIAKAQQPDGYLQTQVQVKKLSRFANRQYHEMYNSGHLMTSACIYNRITGKTNFLDVAVRNADYLYKVFMPQPDSLKRFGFNQSQIMGLVELYRTTKDKRYLQLAELFINMRGKSKVEPDATANYKFIGDMVQERTPLRKEDEAVGHAVLALYFYAGAADVYAETGEKALIDALDRIWESVVDKKMYVTGACGQTHHGVSSNVDMVHEGFINDYMMPNLTAYNETCANIANAMFSYRMMGIHGESKYADIVELVLFNSALSGISIEGKDYFYANPLRVCSNAHDNPDADTEFDERIPYIDCFCCPPNLVRTIAQVSAWAYSLADNGIAVNLYGGNKLNTHLADGSVLSLTQNTNYPWEGSVTLTMQACKREPFKLMLRIPDWATGSTIKINGVDAALPAKAGEYATIERKWKKGDMVLLEMPMQVKLVQGNPLIEEVRNQVAVKRGPVVYCVESPDLPEDTRILDVYLPEDSKLTAKYQPGFLGGVATISGRVMLRKDKEDGMYTTLNKPEWEPYHLQLVPYFSWANRGKSEMTVWMPIMWKPE